MRQDAVRKRFERYLRSRSLKMTPQRRRILETAFDTHDHFSADTLYAWLREEGGEPRVSRATVYRTLALLQEGGFINRLDAGLGELVYEHVAGHRHHDHLVCMECGRIEEFHDERIERLQAEICERRGFQLADHDLRLMGLCRACQGRARKPEAE